MTSLQEKYALLTQQIVTCTKCPLCQNRLHPLVGDGFIHSKIVFIGEAPGKQEDLQKKAFIGAAGKILDEMLLCVHLQRKDIYITNTVKCRPLNNRKPTPDEIQICQKYLIQQLKMIQPKIIVTLGHIAFDTIKKLCKISIDEKNLTQMHGKKYTVRTSYGYCDIVFSYHPAMGLYRLDKKQTLLDDIIKHKKLFEETIL